MLKFVIIGLGGCVGAILRYLVAGACIRWPELNPFRSGP